MNGHWIIVLIAGIMIFVASSFDNAYAREYVAPPGVSISEIRSGEWSPQIPEFAVQSAVEVTEPNTQIREFGNYRVEIKLLYTTVDDPSFHIVGPGGPLAGVGSLLFLDPAEGIFGCTGALLPTGIHILTAAHCVTDFSRVSIPGLIGNVLFETATGDVIIDFASFEAHPDWDGDALRGNDIAIIKLVSTAPVSVPRYDIDRDGSDDLGVPFDKTGYGLAGLGTTGATFY